MYTLEVRRPELATVVQSLDGLLNEHTLYLTHALIRRRLAVSLGIVVEVHS